MIVGILSFVERSVVPGMHRSLQAGLGCQCVDGLYYNGNSLALPKFLMPSCGNKSCLCWRGPVWLGWRVCCMSGPAAGVVWRDFVGELKAIHFVRICEEYLHARVGSIGCKKEGDK